jgi:hypothetical protein
MNFFEYIPIGIYGQITYDFIQHSNKAIYRIHCLKLSAACRNKIEGSSKFFPTYNKQQATNSRNEGLLVILQSQMGNQILSHEVTKGVF